MKILVILFAVLAVTFVTAETVSAAGECYGFGASTREDGLSTQSRMGQQYVQDVPGLLSSVSVNIYGESIATGSVSFSIHETTAGLPNGTIVPGSVVSIASNTLPDFPVGTGQAFRCGDIKPNQTFVFAAPLALNPGQMYAFVFYQTTTFQPVTVGWVQEFPSIAPLEGVDCIGVGCPSHSGWALTDFLGQNYDMVYSVETDIVDAVSNDGKIDGHIQVLREYLRLDSTDGGMIFGLIVVAIIFIIGLMSQVPFMVVAFFNLILVGILSRASIMPPWILIAVVMVAGVAVLFKLVQGTGSKSNEG